jgi:deoxyribodipyrimidine photo-lyase
MQNLFPPTREAGLARLDSFTPAMGQRYATGRNTDRSPSVQDVSMLSPYLRRRLLTEAETVVAASDAHGELAERFVTEVAWRGYFKGWLEQHPSVWDDYLAQLRAGQNRLATEAGLRRVYHDACAGQTGIDGFDQWAQALAGQGWLHNHARMWFASIWIFTLRLPWALGAAFFLRHLLDGDPASNTLSWRWVAGLHTKGKHYVARADNIARFTEGRFNPAGQLDEAPECLTETSSHPLIPLAPASPMPKGRFALLLHDEDLNPETLGLPLAETAAIAVFSTASGAPQAEAFVSAAVDDMVARLNVPVTRLAPHDLASWVGGQAVPVVTPWAPVGPTASALECLDLIRIRRNWDSLIWPHSQKGFFQLRQRLPALLPQVA